MSLTYSLQTLRWSSRSKMLIRVWHMVQSTLRCSQSVKSCAASLAKLIYTRHSRFKHMNVRPLRIFMTFRGKGPPRTFIWQPNGQALGLFIDSWYWSKHGVQSKALHFLQQVGLVWSTSWQSRHVIYFTSSSDIYIRAGLGILVRRFLGSFSSGTI